MYTQSVNAPPAGTPYSLQMLNQLVPLTSTGGIFGESTLPVCTTSTKRRPSGSGLQRPTTSNVRGTDWPGRGVSIADQASPADAGSVTAMTGEEAGAAVFRPGGSMAPFVSGGRDRSHSASQIR